MYVATGSSSNLTPSPYQSSIIARGFALDDGVRSGEMVRVDVGFRIVDQADAAVEQGGEEASVGLGLEHPAAVDGDLVLALGDAPDRRGVVACCQRLEVDEAQRDLERLDRFGFAGKSGVGLSGGLRIGAEQEEHGGAVRRSRALRRMRGPRD
jgi:hypothetical protein